MLVFYFNFSDNKKKTKTNKEYNKLLFSFFLYIIYKLFKPIKILKKKKKIIFTFIQIIKKIKYYLITKK